jgi:hypothetical protein
MLSAQIVKSTNLELDMVNGNENLEALKKDFAELKGKNAALGLANEKLLAGAMKVPDIAPLTLTMAEDKLLSGLGTRVESPTRLPSYNSNEDPKGDDPKGWRACQARTRLEEYRFGRAFDFLGSHDSVSPSTLHRFYCVETVDDEPRTRLLNSRRSNHGKDVGTILGISNYLERSLRN